MSDLWDLVWGKATIDPHELAAAVEREALREGLDTRTRILIRDAAQALTGYWGRDRWPTDRRVRARLDKIRQETTDPVKFPSLKDRLMNRTQAETIRQFLRDLGTRLHQPAQ